jgi:hypothetical protein
MNLPLEVLFGVLAEVKELRADLAAAEARADMHADLGRRTAEALGIPLEEGRAHMPEVAGRLREQNASLVKCLFQMQEVAKVLTRQNSEMLAIIEAAQAAKERTS